MTSLERGTSGGGGSSSGKLGVTSRSTLEKGSSSGASSGSGKLGMSNVLSRSPLLTASDTSTLESVVSKIVSAAVGSLKPVPSSPTPPPAMSTSNEKQRLHLAKKRGVAPPSQVILSEPSAQEVKACASGAIQSSSPGKLTMGGRGLTSAPPTSAVGAVISTPPLSVGGHVDTPGLTRTHHQQHHTPGSIREQVSTLITPSPPSSRIGQLLPPQPHPQPQGSAGSVRVVPDTPLQSLPPGPGYVLSPQLGTAESPCSPGPGAGPLSPLKSPVEQIFEEHSYLASSIVTTTEIDKEKI